MASNICRRSRKDDGVTEPEPLRNTKQSFQKRDSEKGAERIRSISEEEQLRVRRIHEARRRSKKVSLRLGVKLP